MNLNYSGKKSCIDLFVTIFLVLLSSFGYGQVKSWEGTIGILTYGWEEDVNPKFWAMEGGAKGSTTVRASITYPYNMQDPFYQLGNLLGNFGRLDEAADNWKKTVELNPSMSIPWRNLGWYNWVLKNNHTQSELCFRNAIKSRPYDQTLYRDLAGVLIDDGKRPGAISLLEKMAFKGMRRSDIIIDLAQAYLDEARYD